jgi:hypothetical protein
MFSVHNTRREFLRIGSLALGGLALPGLLAARGASQGKKYLRDRSVVLLMLQGGPPQVDTFDPKPDAPAEIRAVGGEIQTALPGVLFGGTFPKLAKLADKLAVVRSFAAGKGGLSHEAGYTALLSASNPTGAVLGSLVARAAGALNPGTGLPTNTLILPEAIDPKLQLGRPSGAFTYEQTLKYFASAGTLGAEYVPFSPAGGNDLLKNLTLQLTPEQFDDRRELLDQLDSFQRKLDSTRDLEGMTSFQGQAVDVLLKGISAAFDLAKEDPKTVAKYDTSALLDLKEIHRGGKKFMPNFSRATNLLGKQMLLARRLCEAGCKFVTVVDSCWDFHDDGNNPPAAVGLPILGPQLDHAVAAFLEDVAQRGLSEKILLIVTAEMGRTPAKKGGKTGGGTGHWGDLTPLVLAGGGLRMGQVVGRSDAKGAFPATERIGPENLMATVLQTLFDPTEVRVASEIPKHVAALITDGKPIRELLG